MRKSASTTTLSSLFTKTSVILNRLREIGSKWATPKNISPFGVERVPVSGLHIPQKFSFPRAVVMTEFETSLGHRTKGTSMRLHQNDLLCWQTHCICNVSTVIIQQYYTMVEGGLSADQEGSRWMKQRWRQSTKDLCYQLFYGVSHRLRPLEAIMISPN